MGLGLGLQASSVHASRPGQPTRGSVEGRDGEPPGGPGGWHAGEEIKRKGNTGSMWEASTVSAEDKAKELNLHGHEHCDNCCPLLSQSDRALCRREAFYGPSSQAQTWTCRLPLICHQAARVRRLSSPASLRSPRLPEYSGMFVEKVYKVYSMKRRERVELLAAQVAFHLWQFRLGGSHVQDLHARSAS